MTHHERSQRRSEVAAAIRAGASYAETRAKFGVSDNLIAKACAENHVRVNRQRHGLGQSRHRASLAPTEWSGNDPDPPGGPTREQRLAALIEEYAKLMRKP